jgi:hypothetical protein
MSDVKTFFIVTTFEPVQPTVYVVKGTLEDVKQRAQHPHCWMNVFSLEAQQGQGPNPWNGTILMHVGMCQPTSAFENAIRYASHFLEDMSPEQRRSCLNVAQTLLSAAPHTSELTLKEPE